MQTPTMPWSKEIELAILCFCVTGEDQEKVEEVINLVRPEYFFSDRHRTIFQTMTEMVRDGTGVDLPKLWDRITAAGIEEKCGGPVFLAALTDSTNRSYNYHGDCTILKRYAMLRAEIKAFNAGIERALTATDDPQDISQGMVKFLQTLEGELLTDNSTDIERNNALQMCASLENQNPAVVITGLAKLDADLGGFRPGELVVIGAETGVGKTVFARQIRRESCARGVHGLYCSGEMDGEQLSQREAAARTGIPMHKFRNPWELDRNDFNRVLDFASGECDKCRVLAGNLNVSRITSASSDMYRRGELGFMVVDYDELVDAPGKTDFEKQNAVARECKAIAMSRHIPVILLSQLRKLQQGERSDKPSRHRLFGGSAKANDASIILFIDRPFVRDLQGDNETEAKIWIIKSRNGALGHVDAQFCIPRMRFSSQEPQSIP